MKINDSNLSNVASTGAAQAQPTGKMSQGTGAASTTQAGGTSSSDDVHLSELVRSLRSLAADSPERQARLESLARSHTNGTYQVDSNATAGKIIDDAIGHS